MARWRRAVLDLSGLRAAWAGPLVNGEPISEPAFSPFRYDITSHIRPSRRNRLAITLWIPWLNAYAPFKHGAPPLSPIMACGLGGAPKVLFFG